MEKLHFTMENPVIQTLCSADPTLALLINRVGDYSLPLRTDYFASLVRSIIGQQLSVKVAQTIWHRFQSLYHDMTPAAIGSIPETDLKKVGLSRTKAIYIQDLSRKIATGAINLTEIDNLPDEEVIRRLIQIKGIGVWTAEMFLIFSLGRLDVLSLGDLGLKRAIQWLYGFKKIPAERTILTRGRK